LRPRAAAGPGRGIGRRRATRVLAVASALLLVSCTAASTGAGVPGTGSAPPGTEAARPTGGTAPGPGGTTTGAPGSAYRSAPCPFPNGPTVDPVRVTCGRLAVAESRERPGGRTIELAVARLSLGDGPAAAEPLVYLEGGPGGSALAELELWTDPVSPLLKDRDVILVDQRGTGYSTPRLTCDPELADPASDALTDAELNLACHDRLTRSGIDLDAYDTVTSAHDVEDLRRALGIDHWHMMGVSYGTRLALEVMRQHPDGIRSVVLDSVYPPGAKGLDDQPANGWAAMKSLLDDCRAEAACNRAYPDLETRFLATIDRLDRDPVTIVRPVDDTGEQEEDVQLDGRELVRALFDALYDTAVLPDVPKALDAAARGDLQRADDLLAGVDVPEPAGGASAPPSGPAPGAEPQADGPPSDTDGLFLTIACAEDAPEASAGSVTQAASAVPEPVRRALVADVIDQLQSCTSWAVRPRHLDPVRSSIPTLLLAGSVDPITPPRWARTAAETLPNATVVEVHGAGHGAIDAGPCVQDAIVAFLAATTPPAPACSVGRPFST